MLSHLMSNGLLFGTVKVSDAGYMLIFFDCMAFTVLVRYWEAAGRIKLWGRSAGGADADKELKTRDR